MKEKDKFSLQNNEKCAPNTFRYTVQSGDTFFTIAKKFDVLLDDLIDANPQIHDPSKICPGQIVCVPTEPSPTDCPPNTFKYTVQHGDTMWNIAQKYGLTLDTLLAANPQIHDPDKISPGQVVCVPKAVSPNSFKCPSGTYQYTVKSGDTLFYIARHFNVSLDTLIKINPQISDPNKIYPGQKICIPKK